MKSYELLSSSDLKEELILLKTEYEYYKEKKLALNMARGKPSSAQLELSRELLDTINSTSSLRDAKDNVDCSNYGELKGSLEARTFFSEYMKVKIEQVIVVGSASLTFMYDCLSRAMLKGVLGSDEPWIYQKPKFLCPVPGYDRHFSICEFLGIELIPVPMDENGPLMDVVEELVSNDASIKGMWCVPKYSNPTGITYSDEVIKRLAALHPKAKDFRVFCDNAYAVHKIYEDTPMLNILDEFQKAGNPNMVYLFGSTSKITFPGSGVAVFAASEENILFTEKQLSMQAISWDKINMLRHVRFLKDMNGTQMHMEKHAEILRPKFEVVNHVLEDELTSRNIGAFIKPLGGYFVTYLAPSGCAKRIVNLCKEMGVILTAAGATHPYGCDPNDTYIRIAPSFPTITELEDAMKIFCIAARISYIENKLSLE